MPMEYVRLPCTWRPERGPCFTFGSSPFSRRRRAAAEWRLHCRSRHTKSRRRHAKRSLSGTVRMVSYYQKQFPAWVVFQSVEELFPQVDGAHEGANRKRVVTATAPVTLHAINRIYKETKNVRTSPSRRTDKSQESWDHTRVHARCSLRRTHPSALVLALDEA